MMKIHSVNGENRVLVGPFTPETDQNPKTKKSGFRAHNGCAAKLLSILSFFRISAGVEKIKIDGKVSYVNLGSFRKWCDRHGMIFKKGDSISDKIQEVILKINPKEPSKEVAPKMQVPKPSDDSPDLKEKIEGIDERLSQLEEEIIVRNALENGIGNIRALTAYLKTQAKEKDSSALKNQAEILPNAPEEMEKPLSAITEIRNQIQDAEKEQEAKMEQAKKAEEVKRAEALKAHVAQIQVRREIYAKIAQVLLPKMEERFYAADGTLKNDAEKQCANYKQILWGMRTEEYPDNLYEQAQEFDELGDSKNAQQCREKAVANEKKLEDCETNFQKTLFPIYYQGYRKELDFFIKPCSPGDVNLEGDFYYPALNGVEDVINKKLDIEVYNKNPNHPNILDSGSGAYLHLQSYTLNKSNLNLEVRNSNLYYRCKLNKLSIKKIAKYHSGVYSGLSACFDRMAHLYIKENIEVIKAALKRENFPDLDNLIDVEIQMELAKPLTNLFIRSFYVQLGYEAVFCPQSEIYGIAYLNLFNPDKALQKIELVQDVK